MPVITESKKKRNTKIRKRWSELYGKGFRAAKIFEMLEEEFYIGASQVYRILENVKELKGKTIDELNEM
jgi:hypothetical protein